MIITNETLLPVTVYGVPSGNYNGSQTTFIGNAVPAANYYAGQGSVQTAVIQTTNFIGNIRIQATLNDWTEQALWFDVDSYGNATASTTETRAINMVGNFVWIRALVTDFTAGTINQANVLF